MVCDVNIAKLGSKLVLVSDGSLQRQLQGLMVAYLKYTIIIAEL